jgi:hypothetical protein
MTTKPESGRVAWDVEVIAYVTVHTPEMVVDTEIMATLSALKFAEFAAPTTLISAPMAGMLPLIIWNVKVAVVVTAELEMTGPVVSVVL